MGFMANDGQTGSVAGISHRAAQHSMPRWMALAFILASVALALATAIFLPVLIVPSSAVPGAAQRLDLQNAVRTTLLQAMAGVLLVAGAYFTWRQLLLGRDQLRQSLATSTAQLQLSREGQTTEQLSRAMEHLGHQSVGVRVGAIFTLEQIARISSQIRPAIHEILASYIRAESHWPHHDPVTQAAIEPGGTEDLPAELPLLKIRAPDIQAAATVLGRRIEIPDEIVELQSADLRAAYLGNANLRRCVIGRAMLALSDLSGSDLSEAHMRAASLRGALLVNAKLSGANLKDADLRGADLSGADLSGADLRNARCDEATMWPGGFDWISAGVTQEAGRPSPSTFA
jgi:hypothetical protein